MVVLYRGDEVKYVEPELFTMDYLTDGWGFDKEPPAEEPEPEPEQEPKTGGKKRGKKETSKTEPENTSDPGDDASEETNEKEMLTSMTMDEVY